MARSPSILAFSILASLGCATAAHAISETNYAVEYDRKVVPLLASADRFEVTAADGTQLSAVRFVHPSSRGTIVVLPGRTEPWLKYGEVFYDLYSAGYSIYSYDHRGQGLSLPHLSPRNPQIGHIDDFEKYVDDLDLFVKSVVVPAVPAGENVYLLAHSMGGGIAADYLERGSNPFTAAVLSAPMLDVNTSPYPEAVARAIAAGGVLMGKGEEYAIGQTDYDPDMPFEKNTVTKSEARFAMGARILHEYPETLMGGASYAWVHQSLKATVRVVREASQARTPTVLFQAGHDSLVDPGGQNRYCARARGCQVVLFPESRHEILMERDFIRDRAFRLILSRFSGN